jgi:hypothetical protein
MPADKSDYDVNITARVRIPNVTRAHLDKEIEKLTGQLDRLGVEVKATEIVEIAPPA